jgi:hypothetical protein
MPFRLRPLRSSFLNTTFTDLKNAINDALWKGGGTLTGALTGTTAQFSGTVSAASATAAGHLVTKAQIEARVLFAEDFGAVGDGTTDDSAAINAGLTYIKANGGTLRLMAKSYRCRDLRLEGGAYPWALVGAGKKATKLIHLDGNGTLLIGTAGSGVPYTLSGFTVDCKHSVYAHASANHGISIADTSGVRIVDIHVTDYKNSAILFFASTPSTYRDNVVVDCSADGLGASANGMLFADMDYCGFVRTHVRNVSKDPLVRSPGYGLQLKNTCKWGFISDSSALTCTVGIAFGNDISATGVQYATITNCRVIDCLGGIELGWSSDNLLSNIYIDMASSDVGTYPGENGINIANSCVGNSFSDITVKNVRSVRSAVRIRTGCTDNTLHFALVDNINTTGTVVTFDSGAQYNHVKLSRMINPRTRSAGIETAAIMSTASDNNSWEYEGYEDFSRNLTYGASVRRYGARGVGGSVDDSAAIQEAIAANYGKKLHFPKGTYRIDAELTITDKIELELDPGAVIDYSNVAAASALGEKRAIAIEGSLASSVAMTANVAVGDKNVTLSSSSTYAVGDYVILRSTEAFMAGATGFSGTRGHISRVQAKPSGTQITLTEASPFAYDYTATGVVRKINAVNGVVIRGGKLLGGGTTKAHNGIRVYGGVDCLIENVTFDGFEDTGVSVYYGYNVTVRNCKIENCTSNGTLGNTGYGIVFYNGTRNSLAVSNYFRNCRHAFAAGADICSILCVVADNWADYCGLSTEAFDCHEPCFWYTFRGNVANGGSGGFGIRGQHTRILDNKVFGVDGAGVRVEHFITSNPNGINGTIIEGNTIADAGGHAILRGNRQRAKDPRRRRCQQHHQ